MKKIILCLLILTLSACSTVNFQSPAHKLAIQYAVGKFIEAGDASKRAAAIISEVTNAQTLIDLQQVPIADVKLAVLRRVADRGLSVADTMLASALIDIVEAQITADISKGIISKDETIRVNAFLDIVKQAAGIYL